MGAGASSNPGETQEIHYPKQSIADISRESKLSYVAVLREWQRWIELGCDEDGVMSVQKLKESYPDDMIMHRLVDTLRANEAATTISFSAFCRNLYLWQTMTMEERLQSLFQILNNGDPINAETMTEIIRAIRPEDHDDRDEIKKISAQMPTDLRCLGTSVIDEEDFVAWAKELPTEELQNKLGNFTIICEKTMAALEECCNKSSKGDKSSS